MSWEGNETENMAQSWAAGCTSCSASRSGSRRIHKKENKVKTDCVYFRSMCLEGKNELWLLFPRVSPGKRYWYEVLRQNVLSSACLAAGRSFKLALVRTRPSSLSWFLSVPRSGTRVPLKAHSTSSVVHSQGGSLEQPSLTGLPRP